MTELSLVRMDEAFDDMFQHIFGSKRKREPEAERESDELAQLIAEETDRALHSGAAWDRAYSDLDENVRTPLLRKARTGDDSDAGQKLIQAIRRQLIATATQLAKDKFNGDAK